MGEKEKGGVCGKAAKGVPTEGAGAPCKGKSAGRRKKVEENKRRRSGTHGQAMRSAARDRKSVEKESSARFMTKGTRALWRRHSG